MFHRPLATVFSSVSIRSLLSTRTFCAPVTLIEDEITTVRTTGIRWTKDDVFGTINGIYWGEGDSRNTKVIKNQDTTNSRYIQLQSVMLALEQAKKDGLKQIRVQTDSNMNEFSIRAEAKLFLNLDPEERKRPQYRNMAYCLQIANIMDEIEVILECQSLPNNRGSNEVIDLLKEGDKPNQDGNSYDMSKHLLESESQRSITLNEASLRKDETVYGALISSLPNLADNDDIPIVRTTAMLSDLDGGTIIGVYWGEGDPRNEIKKNSRDKSNWADANMRSIVIALEQAKKDGLKRILVQSSQRTNESDIREAARQFQSMNHVKKKELQCTMYAYCERIVEIMNEMEVIFEFGISSHNGLSVLTLLKEDRKKQNPTIQIGDFYSPEYQSDWKITPNDASPLEGRIVPTVYVTGRMHNDSDGVITAVWAAESIEHLEHKQRPIGLYKRLYGITSGRVRMESLLEAINEANSLNLPEIQVVTDNLEFIAFFKLGWKKLDGCVMPHNKLYLQIKALTEKNKVHFKGVRLTEDCDDELMKKVYEMAKVPEAEREITKSDTTLEQVKSVVDVARTSPNSSDDDQITTVRTTGIRFMRESDHFATSAMFWGEGDPRNTKEIRAYGAADYRGSRLRSILMALEQAKTDGLKQIRVQTDLEINESGIRDEARKFKSIDLAMIKEEESLMFLYCERLVKIMDEMEVIFEYKKAMSEDGLNEVIRLLNLERENCDGALSFDSPAYKSDWIITPSDVSPLEGRTVPTVYVTGRFDCGKMKGTTASLWAPESIKHLEISQRPCGAIKRLSISPKSVEEVQLRAIWSAIKEAQSCSVHEIQVITDSLYFIHFFKNKWRKNIGKPAAFETLYKEIKALTETTKVHFKGVQFKDSDDELMKKVYEKAKVPM